MKSFFQEAEIVKAQEAAELFQNILNADISTIQQISEEIDNYHISDYSKVAHFLYLSLEFRPFKSHIYKQLLLNLKSPHKSTLFDFFISIEIFSPSIYSEYQTSTKYSFLYDCINLIFPIEKVYIEFLESIQQGYLPKDEILVLFLWIAPEIHHEYEKNITNYGESKNIEKIVLEMYKKQSTINENINKIYSNYQQYSQNDFQQLRQERDNPIFDPLKQKILFKSPIFPSKVYYPAFPDQTDLEITKESEIISHVFSVESIFERCQFKFINPTILQYCAYFNVYEIYDKIVECGANDDMNDTAGNTIPHYAISGYSNCESSLSFIKKIEKKLDFRLTPQLAAELNQNFIFQWLVDSVYYFKYMEQSIFDISSAFSNLHILLFCIENTAYLFEKNIKFDFETPLYESSKNGNLEVIKLILPAFLKYHNTNEINFTRSEMTPFYAAFHNKRIRVLEYFLSLSKELNINVNFIYRGKSALFRAVELNQIGMVNLLLQFPNINPNIKSGGMTPLHQTSLNGNDKIVELLLSNDRTDPNISTITISFFF